MIEPVKLPTFLDSLGLNVGVSPHALGGAAAGCVTSTLLYPLELVKSRFQMGSHSKFSYRNTFTALGTIYTTDGIRELYRGFPAGLVGSTLSWGLYFWMYEDIKQRSRQFRGAEVSTSLDHWTSSVLSSMVVQTLLCPLWVVKLNQQLGNINGFWSGFTNLFQKEGFRGLYRGLLPGYWSCTHLAAQFVIYEECKRFNYFPDSLPINTLFSTVVSKSLATMVTSPIEVVKVRLRSASVRPDQSIRGICREIWQREKIRGFYKGVGTALIRILPGQCLTFLTYELVVRYLK